MENFTWNKFTKKITIKAPIEEVYAAWASAEKLEGWFLSEANYFNPSGEVIDKNELTSAPGSYAWSWFSQDGIENGKVIEANGTDILVVTFAGNCVVKIKLEVLDDEILVILEQTNIPEDNNSKQNIRLGCASGWSFYLVNLKSVLEGGIDLRNKKPIVGLVNN